MSELHLQTIMELRIPHIVSNLHIHYKHYHSMVLILKIFKTKCKTKIFHDKLTTELLLSKDIPLPISCLLIHHS